MVLARKVMVIEKKSVVTFPQLRQQDCLLCQGTDYREEAQVVSECAEAATLRASTTARNMRVAWAEFPREIAGAISGSALFSLFRSHFMPLTKRRKLSVDENIAGDPPPKDLTLDNLGDEAGDSSDASEDASDDEQPGSSDSDSLGTEDEIAEAQRPTKSKKTQKRKRRATSPSQFGATLQSLLGTDAPTNLPLSLKPSVAKKRTEEILEVKAKKLLEGEKKEKEERNHVTDVIGGWGGESERSLRKVAQRGGTC